MSWDHTTAGFRCGRKEAETIADVLGLSHEDIVETALERCPTVNADDFMCWCAYEDGKDSEYHLNTCLPAMKADVKRRTFHRYEIGDWFIQEYLSVDDRDCDGQSEVSCLKWKKDEAPPTIPDPVVYEA